MNKHPLKSIQHTEIRLATTEDAIHIALLGRITFTETFGHFFKDPTDLLTYYRKTFSVEKIRTGLQNPQNVFFIAFVNELPVGYAKLKKDSQTEFLNNEHTCQLQKIYVLKDFLSIKIGFQLQNMLLEKATALQFKTIWLSVLESNERAVNFYKKSQFKQIGTHDFQIGKENFEFIAMAKKL